MIVSPAATSRSEMMRELSFAGAESSPVRVTVTTPR
jgi:hypothetical protein